MLQLAASFSARGHRRRSGARRSRGDRSTRRSRPDPASSAWTPRAPSSRSPRWSAICGVNVRSPCCRRSSTPTSSPSARARSPAPGSRLSCGRPTCCCRAPSSVGRRACCVALMRRAYRAADRIVAVSRSVATSLTEELGLDARRIRTIYNPIVTAALYEKATAALDDPWFAPGAPPVVLGVGRLAPQKDFATLIRAFAQLRAGRQARLVILGEGPERRPARRADPPARRRRRRQAPRLRSQPVPLHVARIGVRAVVHL